MKKRIVFKCANCGHEYGWSHAHEQVTVNRGTRRYVCDDCFEVQRYGVGNDTQAHTTKKHGITIGYELECVPYDDTCKAAMISAVYGLVPTHDGSLPSDGIEFCTPVYRSLNGIKQMLKSFEKFCDFSDESCGHHLNVGHVAKIDSCTMRYIANNAQSIFNPLGQYLREHRHDTIKVFGRYFTDYADFTIDYNFYEHHCSFINLDHDNRIEFRLCKFVNATQYLWLTCMCSDIVTCIINNFIDKDRSAKDAEKTGEKIVRIFQKYAEGKANCQRPERNSKIA